MIARCVAARAPLTIVRELRWATPLLVRFEPNDQFPIF